MIIDKSPVKVEDVNLDLEGGNLIDRKLLENPWKMRPTTQSILEGGLKNGSLSPLLHLGLFAGSLYIKKPTPDFSSDSLGQETCRA